MDLHAVAYGAGETAGGPLSVLFSWETRGQLGHESGQALHGMDIFLLLPQNHLLRMRGMASGCCLSCLPVHLGGPGFKPWLCPQC